MSREARIVWPWMDFYRRSSNVARTCRHFGISRQTFYRWRHRYDPQNLYNIVRPHQSLGYLTPQQFLLRGSSQRKE